MVNPLLLLLLKPLNPACHIITPQHWLKIDELNTTKCIGDDTKAATRQSLNCIKNKQKIKYGEKRFLPHDAMQARP